MILFIVKVPSVWILPPSSPDISIGESIVTAEVFCRVAPFSITNLLAAVFTPPKQPYSFVLLLKEFTFTVPPLRRVPPL